MFCSVLCYSSAAVNKVVSWRNRNLSCAINKIFARDVSTHFPFPLCSMVDYEGTKLVCFTSRYLLSKISTQKYYSNDSFLFLKQFACFPLHITKPIVFTSFN